MDGLPQRAASCGRGWFVDADELHEQIEWLAARIDDTREQVITQERRTAVLREATIAIAREQAEARGRPRLSLVPNARRARSGGAA